MNYVIALSWLKYASFALTAAASAWALIARTTFEENGRKKLTSAGYLSVAMIIGSALIGSISFGFEGIMKENELAAKKLVDTRDKQAKAQKDALDQQRDATRRAEAANLATMQIILAGQERDRQLVLAKQVGEGVERNLDKTGTAINDIGRVLQPIDPLKLTVIWRSDALSQSSRWVAHLAELARAVESEDRGGSATNECLDGASFAGADGRYWEVEIKQKSCQYPDGPTEAIARSLGEGIGGAVSIVRDATSARWSASIGNQPGVKNGIGNGAGDLDFEVGNNSTAMKINLKDQSMTFRVSQTIAPASQKRTGAIASIQDLEGSVLILRAAGILIVPSGQENRLVQEEGRLTPTEVVLSAGGRTYQFSSKQIKKIATRTGNVFALKVTDGR